MTSLWCSDCGIVRLFEPVPDGVDYEWACTGCGAAAFVGDLPLPERVPVAAVA